MKDINDVIKENEKLVTYVIKKYFPYELTNEDTHQIGLIGLWEAIQKFDSFKNVKFETFAIACIKLKIAREMQYRAYAIRADDKDLLYDTEETKYAEVVPDNGPTPEHEALMKEVWDSFNDMERKVITLKAKGERDEEIANKLGITSRTVRRRTKDIKNKFKVVI